MTAKTIHPDVQAIHDAATAAGLIADETHDGIYYDGHLVEAEITGFTVYRVVSRDPSRSPVYEATYKTAEEAVASIA